MLQRNEVVTLDPRLTLELTLDIQAFREFSGDCIAIRLDFTDERGHILHEFQTELPSLVAPTLRAIPTEPRPEQPPPGLPTTVREERPEETQRAPTVRFRGLMGDRAAFSIRTKPDAQTQEVLVRQQEEVIAGWILESLSSTPTAVMLRHKESGRTLTIPRGNETQLSG